MQLPSNNVINGVILLSCISLIAGALFMQHIMGLQPCYLCITQRVVIISIGLVALIAFLHKSATNKIYSILISLLAITGAFFSSKQLWLQSLPEDQVPACGPPAEYLFDVFNFTEALGMLLQGDGNCAEVQWTLFNISIPGWTLVAFISLALLGVIQVIRKP